MTTNKNSAGVTLKDPIVKRFESKLGCAAGHEILEKRRVLCAAADDVQRPLDLGAKILDPRRWQHNDPNLLKRAQQAIMLHTFGVKLDKRLWRKSQGINSYTQTLLGTAGPLDSSWREDEAWARDNALATLLWAKVLGTLLWAQGSVATELGYLNQARDMSPSHVNYLQYLWFGQRTYKDSSNGCCKNPIQNLMSTLNIA